MAEVIFRSPIPAGDVSGPNLTISDATAGTKSRVVGDSLAGVTPGKSARHGDALVYSTSPNEWTVLGDISTEMRWIDLTHVRAVIRISGADTTSLLAKVCALDFGDAMFPNGAAARTSVAKTASEVVRDDQAGTRSYLIVTSRSFGEYLHHVLVDQAGEFGV